MAPVIPARSKALAISFRSVPGYSIRFLSSSRRSCASPMVRPCVSVRITPCISTMNRSRHLKQNVLTDLLLNSIFALKSALIWPLSVEAIRSLHGASDLLSKFPWMFNDTFLFIVPHFSISHRQPMRQRSNRHLYLDDKLFPFLLQHRARCIAARSLAEKARP